MALEHLNALSFSDLRAWLFDALHDRVALPKLTPDEAPDIALFAAEHTLDKPTRRDLARACRELARDFIRGGEGDLSYVRALLHLTSSLELKELSGELADMARRFPALPTLDIKIRQTVLLTIVDLKVIQPPDFWPEIFNQDRSAYAGAALSGLFAQSWQAGFKLLLLNKDFPDDAMLAGIAAVIVDQALEDLPPHPRAECLNEIAQIAPRCPPALRSALEELLDEYHATHSPQHTELNEALRRRFPTTAAPHVGTPQSSRLVRKKAA